jgi:hypothetical protein
MTTRTPPLLLHIEPGPDRQQLLAENVRLRAEVARLRAGEEPAELHQPVTTGGHLLWALNCSSPEVRLSMATGLVSTMRHSNVCFEANHEGHLQHYKQRVTRLEDALRSASDEARRLSEVSDGAGRSVALTIGFVLAQGVGGVL